MHREQSGSIDRAVSAEERAAEAAYTRAEESFTALLKAGRLDEQVICRPQTMRRFERGLENALSAVYTIEPDTYRSGADAIEGGHLFLQRVLYRINRLKLFWFDDLSNYENEDSRYLQQTRSRIEAAWQSWERAQLAVTELSREDACEALLRRSASDVSPPCSANGRYFRHQVSEAGYRRLLAIASLDGTVEASQLSRTLGGVSNDIHSMMTRLLVEEYGGGRLNRKHSTFFQAMLNELNMCTEPEAYFDLVPWEVLAAINHSFLLSERKRFYLRYVGGLLYTEISVPAAFDNYRAAAERLLMSQAARGYWDLHIKEDKRHGQWMLHDVALPLAVKYPKEAWELVLGYDQQEFISARAAGSIARSVRAAEREAANWETAGQSAA
jgi:hypothetical protein